MMMLGFHKDYTLLQTDLEVLRDLKVGPVDGGDFVGGNYVATINLSAELPMRVFRYYNY